MVVFWKCNEYFKSKCEASVATMKKDRERVVILNDTHLHLKSKKPSSGAIAKVPTRATTRAPTKRRF